MAKLDTPKTQSAFEELSNFASQQAIMNALERAGKDRKLLRKAKRDARAFLEDEGLKPPPRTDITVSERRIGVGQIRVCITVCRVVGSFVVCVTICTRIIVIVAE
ncbi:MAG: hypothetical protein ACREP6_04165 [Candidatus Binataceae bacterium]